jgi:hypothetical protein
MTDRPHADPVPLEGITDRPGRPGDSPQAAGASGPDAGVGTPIFDELLARHARDLTGGREARRRPADR